MPAALTQPRPEDAAKIPENRKPMSETEMRVRVKAQQGRVVFPVFVSLLFCV